MNSDVTLACRNIGCEVILVQPSRGPFCTELTFCLVTVEDLRIWQAKLSTTVLPWKEQHHVRIVLSNQISSLQGQLGLVLDKHECLLVWIDAVTEWWLNPGPFAKVMSRVPFGRVPSCPKFVASNFHDFVGFIWCAWKRLFMSGRVLAANMQVYLYEVSKGSSGLDWKKYAADQSHDFLLSILEGVLQSPSNRIYDHNPPI